MDINKPLFQWGYRLIILILTLIGLYLNMRTRGFAQSIIYFTIQSNFLVLLFTGYLLLEMFLSTFYKSRKSLPNLIHLKGAIMIAISVTFLVFHFLLRGVLIETGYAEYVQSFQSYLLHYVIPILFIGDWFLFDEKGQFRKHAPFLWLIFPYLYLIFAWIRAELFGVIGDTDSRFPYFFMDIDQLGFGVLYYIMGITLFFLAYSYLILFLDKKLPKFN